MSIQKELAKIKEEFCQGKFIVGLLGLKEYIGILRLKDILILDKLVKSLTYDMEEYLLLHTVTIKDSIIYQSNLALDLNFNVALYIEREFIKNRVFNVSWLSTYYSKLILIESVDFTIYQAISTKVIESMTSLYSTGAEGFYYDGKEVRLFYPKSE